MNNSELKESQINKVAAENNCCNGYVYYDGRAGDLPIFVHDKHCPRGKQEAYEQQAWDCDRR